MSSRLSSEQTKAEAKSLGFFACGLAKAAPVSHECATTFNRWLANKGHAGMDYMERNTDKRLDPTMLVSGVKTIICVALNYAPSRRMPEGELQLASYALGKDYHDIVKSRLHALAYRLGITEYRAFCDTAPVLERYWAVQAGLGWTGRNHQLVIPHSGTMFFLGELFVSNEADEYDAPVKPRCGTCDACIKACPTGALSHDGTFCSSKCLSYLTIENRGDIPTEFTGKMGNTIYGCDRCQDACPWNRFATPTDDPQLKPPMELLDMTRADWQQLSIEQYRRLFKGSAVKRAKYEGLMRNICAALPNDNNPTK